MPDEGTTNQQTTIEPEIDGRSINRSVTVPFSKTEVSSIQEAMGAWNGIRVVATSGSGAIREAYLQNGIPSGYALIDREAALQEIIKNLAVWYVVDRFTPATLTDEHWQIVDESVEQMIVSLIPGLIDPDDFITAVLEEARKQLKIRLDQAPGSYVYFLASLTERCCEIQRLEEDQINPIDRQIYTSLLGEPMVEVNLNEQEIDYFWKDGTRFQRARRNARSKATKN